MNTITRPERQRLLDAMLAEVVEKGYLATEVEAAARRARIAGEGWSNWFPDKEACVLAAFDQVCEQLTAAIKGGSQRGEDWVTKVAGGLSGLLGCLAERPELAEALARSLPSIGPRGQARYQAFIEGLAPLLREGRRCSETDEELPETIELLAVGAAEALVFDEIQAGRTEHLESLAPEILFSLLVPFVGPQDAREAMQAARQT